VTAYTCPICDRLIVKEPHAVRDGSRPASPGSHNPALHVAKAYAAIREPHGPLNDLGHDVATDEVKRPTENEPCFILAAL
jgi:hypothetical protein